MQLEEVSYQYIRWYNFGGYSNIKIEIVDGRVTIDYGSNVIPLEVMIWVIEEVSQWQSGQPTTVCI